MDASAKIYAYRVDSVYSDTFKFLGGLSRNDREIYNEIDNEMDENFNNLKKLSSRHCVKNMFYLIITI